MSRSLRAKAEEEGRLIPLSAATARAIAAYLRQRRHHKHAASPALWLGLRDHGPVTGWGLYRMLKRRADQAGYDPAEIHPHQFRPCISHLIEDGVDPLFVQQQAGHSRASTTAVYTTVGQDARNRMLRSALARVFETEEGT
jgi:integrase/recombinase XerC